jgi:hypothetical protein
MEEDKLINKRDDKGVCNGFHMDVHERANPILGLTGKKKGKIRLMNLDTQVRLALLHLVSFAKVSFRLSQSLAIPTFSTAPSCVHPTPPTSNSSRTWSSSSRSCWRTSGKKSPVLTSQSLILEDD